jgi:F-type H+-transporting ATPase subunit b
MKARSAIASIVFAVALAPAPALAGEEGADAAQWIRLLFFAINFSLFVFVLVYFAAPLVRKFFSDRSGAVRATLSRAAAALADAQDLVNRAAARLAGLETEKARMVEQFNAETAHQVRTIVELARSAAERIGRDSELTAAAMEEAAGRRVRNRMAAGAAEIARNLITRDFGQADQKRLVETFMHKLGEEVRP